MIAISHIADILDMVITIKPYESKSALYLAVAIRNFARGRSGILDSSIKDMAEGHRFQEFGL
jgi:hypothetical protein